MRAIWKGTISFGLVSIPIALFPAVRREELKFRLLRSPDLSPVNYKRVAEADGKEVPWEKIVKGYKYEKGRYIVLKDEDFARVDVEATQTVDIINFVELTEVNPVLFYKPYFMEAEKGGEKAYALLRQTLADSGKIGITKVIIKTRQHLAAIKPQKSGLMLELMHFPAEILDTSEFKAPADKPSSKAEMTMAKKLVESMTDKWDPKMFKDDYHEMLEKIVEEKIHAGAAHLAPAKKKHANSKIIDLASVLQESIKATEARSRASAKTRKKAA